MQSYQKPISMAITAGFDVIDTHKNKHMLSIMVNTICYNDNMKPL